MMNIKNKIEVNGEITVIYLKRRNSEDVKTIVDTKNLEKLKELGLTWTAKWAKNTNRFYCQASKYLGIINGKPKYKTANLRPRTFKENSKNRKGANSNAKTGVRNVSFSNKKYIVQFMYQGKNKVFGRFENLNEAASVAEKIRRKLYKN
ncbi:hypothetical protein ABR330_14485 [Bacillus cabrialesii subsp. cabrialesii]|uniref:hypothetical protein n=1 Tax=Bacillus cabrialesii TaxID=2487276 RepID=UPI0033059722